MSDSTGNSPTSPLPPGLAEFARDEELRRQVDEALALRRRESGEYVRAMDEVLSRWDAEWINVNASLAPIFTGGTASHAEITASLIGVGRVIYDHDRIPHNGRRTEERSTRRVQGSPITLAGKLDQVLSCEEFSSDPPKRAAQLLRGAVEATTEQLSQCITPMLADNDVIPFAWMDSIRVLLDPRALPCTTPAPRPPHGLGGWGPAYWTKDAKLLFHLLRDSFRFAAAIPLTDSGVTTRTSEAGDSPHPQKPDTPAVEETAKPPEQKEPDGPLRAGYLRYGKAVYRRFGGLQWSLIDGVWNGAVGKVDVEVSAATVFKSVYPDGDYAKKKQKNKFQKLVNNTNDTLFRHGFSLRIEWVADESITLRRGCEKPSQTASQM